MMKSNNDGLEDTNFVVGLHGLIRRWSSRAELEASKIELRISREGNINSRGDTESPTAAVFTVWHPMFHDALEPGIKELVVLLVEKLGCITYSSCQGHPPASEHAEFPLRHVSFITRKSHNHALEVLQLAARNVNQRLNSDCIIEIVIRQRTVITNDGPSIKGHEVVFRALINDFPSYKRDIEKVYFLFNTELVAILRKIGQPLL
jgi:hypothetical protein